MVNSSIKKIAVGLLTAFVFSAGLLGNLTCANEVQAQESKDIQVAEIEFLNHCDLEDLVVITVTESQAAEMLETVNEIIGDSKTDYEKAELIYNWIVKNITYEASHVEISADPYGVFTGRKAVCGGFANLYREMLNLAGIPAVALAGYYTDFAHAWNAVYADDRWFYADGTDAYGTSFDNPNLVNSHHALEVVDVTISAGDVLLGYYQGVAVIGTQNGIKNVTIPEEYDGMKIESISYQFFNIAYSVEELNIGSNINYISVDSLKSSTTLRQVNVAEDNAIYASKDGILYSKDFKELLAYPKACTENSFTIPKETTVLDLKDALGNENLTTIDVEKGNSLYSSYDGALYNVDQTELLFIPAGKTSVKVPANATISDMAFAFADRNNMVIYGTPGSYAETYAGWYGMQFVDISEVETEEDEVIRLSGTTRYETGYKVADAFKEALGVEKFDAVVVATGKNFADALAGSYLAVRKDAPIILTNGKDDNVAQLHEYIAANVAEGGKVYILGGEGAVPASVAAIDGYDVVRLSGKTRYETNLAILEEAGVAGDEIIVATGKAFADSLSASAAKLPILLVKPGAALSDEAKAIAEERNKFYIIGGEGAVSADIEAELAAYGEVVRVAGKTRYETSVAVANTFFADVEEAVVASGKNFPDGLCGGPLAAAMDAPLILTADGKTEAAADYMADNGAASGFVLGGTGALADESVIEVFSPESADEIVLK